MFGPPPTALGGVPTSTSTWPLLTSTAVTPPQQPGQSSLLTPSFQQQVVAPLDGFPLMLSTPMDMYSMAAAAAAASQMGLVAGMPLYAPTGVALPTVGGPVALPMPQAAVSVPPMTPTVPVQVPALSKSVAPESVPPQSPTSPTTPETAKEAREKKRKPVIQVPEVPSLLEKRCRGGPGKKRKGISDEEKLARQQDRVVRNRIAAQESRNKKRAYFDTLETTAAELQETNERLQDDNERLTKRVKYLEDENKTLHSKLDWIMQQMAELRQARAAPSTATSPLPLSSPAANPKPIINIQEGSTFHFSPVMHVAAPEPAASAACVTPALALGAHAASDFSKSGSPTSTVGGPSPVAAGHSMAGSEPPVPVAISADVAAAAAVGKPLRVEGGASAVAPAAAAGPVADGATVSLTLTELTTLLFDSFSGPAEAVKLAPLGANSPQRRLSTSARGLWVLRKASATDSLTSLARTAAAVQATWAMQTMCAWLRKWMATASSWRRCLERGSTKDSSATGSTWPHGELTGPLARFAPLVKAIVARAVWDAVPESSESATVAEPAQVLVQVPLALVQDLRREARARALSRRWTHHPP
ncbi:hypothetical protein AMAG_00764 [Allomyces macrogynus ATCC 38327]|uniref:X-box-binding protein 1 n=1 Tax=Allomyces macrogynus (strain ATCC 38327) TaxID=578462 RepID=A0A0L0RWT6_ALLM3|nr:hypothetical protein AMAG_00764 [Allomyces macrogynus ATCC 38327]|eukprot:KNE54813.1 hypothetical protein AMAG_00764 [Allomyces macrogynus ATCC 38327]